MWHLPRVAQSLTDPQDCCRQWSQDRVALCPPLQHCLPQQWHQDSLPSALVPTAPPAPHDTWAQCTHKTDGTHWDVPVGVSGHRAAAEILSYPSGWEGALRDGHSHQPHHVTVQVDTASVLPMPQNPPAEVW